MTNQQTTYLDGLRDQLADCIADNQRVHATNAALLAAGRRVLYTYEHRLGSVDVAKALAELQAEIRRAEKETP
jgi:hypothetical protein